jgi:glycerol transport system permease protein
MAMEVWHWTPLVALLCYAGMRAIPEAYYQAAKIDGASAWRFFATSSCPKCAVSSPSPCCCGGWTAFSSTPNPLRLPAGGPGNSTTFLSIYLVKLATGQFDLGPAAAFSLIYFLIVLLFSFIFYQALLNVGKGEKVS